MDHRDAGDSMQQHAMWDCDAHAIHPVGGSWVGHFVPGLVMLIWGAQWAFATFHGYLMSRVQGPGAYRGKAVHRVLLLPERLLLEPWIKATLPCLAMLLELWLGHPEYRSLLCPVSSSRAGHLVLDHLNNWGHATMYPGFIISGLVDLTATYVELPPGVQHTFLSLAFSIAALIMGAHKKHTALDQAVHQLLCATMATTAALVLAEGARPRSFLLGCGKCAAVLLQGTWFLAITRIMFEGRPAWQDQDPQDMAPSMFAPILFAWHVLGVVLALFVAFVAMSLWLHWGARPNGSASGNKDGAGRHKWRPLPLASSSCGSEDSIELSEQGREHWGV